MIGRYEDRIIKRFMVGDRIADDRIDQVKEIFNEKAELEERKRHLHNLIKMWDTLRE